MHANPGSTFGANQQGAYDGRMRRFEWLFTPISHNRAQVRKRHGRAARNYLNNKGKLARPTRLTRIAIRRCSPLRGAVGVQTLTRFVELVTPAFGGRKGNRKILSPLTLYGKTPVANAVLGMTTQNRVTQISHSWKRFLSPIEITVDLRYRKEPFQRKEIRMKTIPEKPEVA